MSKLAEYQITKCIGKYKILGILTKECVCVCDRQGDVLLGEPSHQQERRAQVRSEGGQVP